MTTQKPLDMGEYCEWEQRYGDWTPGAQDRFKALIAEVERLREALAKVARAKAREKKGRVPSGAR